MTILLKRIYDKPSAKDGYRILVDRIWPRGLSKDAAGINEWIKDIAPSTELRKWFGHDPEKWPEFKKRYFKELKDHKEQVAYLKEIVHKHHTTLVYAARDEVHNNAAALKEYLEKG